MQLSQAEVTQQNQQKYLISGIVDFSSVVDLLRRLSGFFAAVKTSAVPLSDNAQVMVDFSQVEECNSAALALMLEIVKSARKENIEVQFEGLPASLLTIAKAYGVENEIRELCK